MSLFHTACHGSWVEVGVNKNWIGKFHLKGLLWLIRLLHYISPFKIKLFIPTAPLNLVLKLRLMYIQSCLLCFLPTSVIIPFSSTFLSHIINSMEHIKENKCKHIPCFHSSSANNICCCVCLNTLLGGSFFLVHNVYVKDIFVLFLSDHYHLCFRL